MRTAYMQSVGREKSHGTGADAEHLGKQLRCRICGKGRHRRRREKARALFQCYLLSVVAVSWRCVEENRLTKGVRKQSLKHVYHILGVRFHPSITSGEHSYTTITFIRPFATFVDLRSWVGKNQQRRTYAGRCRGRGE